MLILKRRYEFWFSIIALHKLGAIAIPATHLLTKKDIVYRAKEAGATGFYNNVNMASQTLPLNSTPPENEVTSLLTRQSATLTEYSTKQTATGEAAVAAYTLEVAGNKAYGTLIMVPTSKSSGGPSDYASIYVSAGSAEEAKQISNTILDTIH